MVTSWPGSAPLMAEALMARDTYLVAGCAAAGAAFLAAGILAADIAHALDRIRGCALERHAREVCSRALAAASCSPRRWLAPYGPGRQFAGYPFAPPMRPAPRRRCGAWHAPFAYPIRVVDPIERRYAEDRSRRSPSFAGEEPWFLLGSDRSDATSSRAC